jgi:hypothetical protein
MSGAFWRNIIIIKIGLHSLNWPLPGFAKARATGNSAFNLRLWVRQRHHFASADITCCYIVRALHSAFAGRTWTATEKPFRLQTNAFGVEPNHNRFIACRKPTRPHALAKPATLATSPATIGDPPLFHHQHRHA